MISEDGFKLAPESFTKIFDLRVYLRPPFENGKLWFRWSFGCDGSPMKLIEIESRFSDVERIYRQLLAGPQTEGDKKQFVCDLFNLPSLDYSIEPQRQLSTSNSGPQARRIRMRMQHKPR